MKVRVWMTACSGLLLVGCAGQVPWREIRTEGRFAGTLPHGNEALTLELHGRMGALHGAGWLGDKRVLFQEVPERNALGILALEGGATLPMILRFAPEGVQQAPEEAAERGAVVVALKREGSASGASHRGDLGGVYRRSGLAAGGVDVAYVSHVGGLLVGEVLALGKRLALVAQVDDRGRIAGRLEAADGTGLIIQGLIHDGELRIDGAGLSSVLKR